MKELDKPNNSELEQSLIGTMMIDSSCVDEALSLVTEKDIYNNNNKVIFKTIKKLNDNGENVDLINVTRKIRELGKLEEIGGAYYVTSVTQYSTYPSELFKRCLILKELTARRDLIEASTRSYQRAFDMNQDIFESLEKHDKELMDIRDMESISDNVLPISNLLQEEMVTLTKNMANPTKISGISTGFENLDNVLHGMKAGQSICLAARPAQGKAQPLHSKVLTPNGWVEIGSLKIGDIICASNGENQYVNGVYHQGKKKNYKVIFDDRTEVLCCDEHLWQTSTRLERRYGSPKVRELKEIRNTLRVNADNRKNHSIPFVKPMKFSKKELTIHPYLLGVMLGDGCFGKMSLTNCEQDIIDRISSLVPNDVVLKRDTFCTKTMQYTFVRTTGNKNNLKEMFRELGMLELKSATKYIPDNYLYSDFNDRLEMLRGLLDTDGFVEKWGQTIEYSTVSEHLRDGVQFLVQSLGGRVVCSKHVGKYKKDGVLHVCKDYYKLKISFTNDVIPVSSKKHLAKYKKCSKGLQKYIENIVEYGYEECVCISVSSSDKLYVTDGFNLTHNTSLAINICTNVAQSTKKAVLVFSIEMEKRELVLRLMSSESSVEAHRISTGNISVDEFNTIMHSTDKYMDTNLLLDDSGRVTMPKIRNICKKHSKRYGGIELIVVDFLQLIQTDTNSQNREKEISSITRDIKLLAKELSCPVIHLSQLSRKCEDRADKRPILSDLRDSGTIEENSDVVMFVFRPEYYGILKDENGDSTEGKADIIIAKNRGGSVGTIGIKFDGRYTRFSNDTYYQQPVYEINPNRNLEPNREDNQF